MSDKWREVTIEDIAERVAMGPFGSNIKTDNFVDSGVPIIRGGNLNGERFIDEEFVFLTEDKADELRSANAFPGDIVFTHRGTLGQVGIIPRTAKYKRYVVSQSQMKLTCDKGKADPLFVFYYFKSARGQQELLANTSTTGVPAISRPLTSLKQIRFQLPPLSIQSAIACILGELDDKIENNRRMNATLEAMARTVFKSWFVDFDPVRAKAEGRKPSCMDATTAALFPASFQDSPIGKIPKGWKTIPLGELVEVTKGLSYKGCGLSDAGIPLHNLNSIYEGGGYKHEGLKHYTGEYKDRHIVVPGDVIVANTEQGFDHLLIGYPSIIPKRYGNFGLFTHHIYRVRPRNDSPLTNHFIYLLLLMPSFRDQVISYTNGTTVNSLSADGLLRPVFTLPQSEIIQIAEKLFSPLLEQQEALFSESRTLAKIRDTLLPKLMTGEIRIKDSEKLVEDKT